MFRYAKLNSIFFYFLPFFLQLKSWRKISKINFLETQNRHIDFGFFHCFSRTQSKLSGFFPSFHCLSTKSSFTVTWKSKKKNYRGNGNTKCNIIPVQLSVDGCVCGFCFFFSIRHNLWKNDEEKASNWYRM